ncbi:hypothetical protein Patl1_32739 [Pistacia atlantica]|uniref:Uncharacterized protein n=1 Tax=Pistacia atlantica TaxID=434234 RepID=A0ACC1AQ50_9ROSI|nr:hypothetical protein Patl1_32739 [Pistacia atlantica]
MVQKLYKLEMDNALESHTKV